MNTRIIQLGVNIKQRSKRHTKNIYNQITTIAKRIDRYNNVKIFNNGADNDWINNEEGISQILVEEFKKISGKLFTPKKY